MPIRYLEARPPVTWLPFFWHNTLKCFSTAEGSDGPVAIRGFGVRKICRGKAWAGLASTGHTSPRHQSYCLSGRARSHRALFQGQNSFFAKGAPNSPLEFSNCRKATDPSGMHTGLRNDPSGSLRPTHPANKTTIPKTKSGFIIPLLVE
jgi:hypothetical protein